MASIQTSRLPIPTTYPVSPKPQASAAFSPSTAAPAPAAALDLSAAARKFLDAETNNVPWGNSPVRDR